MPRIGFSADLLRPSAGEQSHRVTYVELFFDLVFVFAITQVSHILIHEQSGIDLVHTLVLGFTVWWVWVYTTWASSWLNPETGPVRGLFIVLMFFGMLVSIAIPDAFGERALLFAVSMVALNLSRSLFTVLAFARNHPGHAVNFVRISVWHAASGAVWIVGTFVPHDDRLWVWLAALLIDLIGPRARFWVPGMGASGLDTWNISGEHMSERVSLFLIIALGESIVVTGSTFGVGSIGWASFAAFVAAFVGTVLMWLLYFTHNQRGGSEYLTQADERGMIAQTAFTYIPILFVFGIVLTAVADGLVLEDPTGATHVWTAGLLTGAAALYLLANALFRRAVGGPWLVSHLIGAVVALALFASYSVLSPLALSWLVNLVFLLVVVFGEVTGRRRRRPASGPSGA